MSEKDPVLPKRNSGSGTREAELGKRNSGSGTREAELGWERLLADYNLFKGRVWVLVLISTFLAPWLVGTYLGKLNNLGSRDL